MVPSGLNFKPVATDSSSLISSGVPVESAAVVILFALAPSLTDRVASSLIVPVLLAATGSLEL